MEASYCGDFRVCYDEGLLKEGAPGTPLTKHFAVDVGDIEFEDPYRANPRVRRLIANQMLAVLRDPLAEIVMDMFDQYESLVEAEWRKQREEEAEAGPLPQGS